MHRVLVGKPEGKRPVGRHKRRWEDNIKMDLQELGGSCGDWMELAQDRDRWRALVGTVRNLRVPKMRGISWLAAEPVSFSSRTLLHGVSVYARCLCCVVESVTWIERWFCGSDKGALYPYACLIRIHCICILGHYIPYKPMYLYAPALEAAAVTVFMVGYGPCPYAIVLCTATGYL